MNGEPNCRSSRAYPAHFASLARAPFAKRKERFLPGGFAAVYYQLGAGYPGGFV